MDHRLTRNQYPISIINTFKHSEDERSYPTVSRVAMEGPEGVGGSMIPEVATKIFLQGDS